MMHSKEGYVKSGLIRKVENESFGSAITIDDVRSGGKTRAFTYCGTLPIFGENGAVSTQTTMMTIWQFAIDLYISSKNTLIMRSLATGSGIVPTAPENYVLPRLDDTFMQPYVAFTLYFPTETSQIMTLQYEGMEKLLFEGYWSKNLNYNDVVTQVGGGNKPIDLGLVYDRVLTDNELEQNYRAFLQKHR
jgi:hypothetical protein